MTPDRWQRVQLLFEEVWEAQPQARMRLLAKADQEDPQLASRVRELLETASSVGTFLETPALLLRGAAYALASISTLDASLPTDLGPFELGRRLGAGGMGVVYEATQRNPHRQVALKLLRPGLASPAAIRRFRLESAVLARLDHPAIARVFAADAALVEGRERPYFAMELVKGKPITAFASASNLDHRACAMLMATVADAVHHAHQRAVIHRDLKPSNILVCRSDDGTPTPKILDFGVARLAVDHSVLQTTDPAPADASAGPQTLAGALIGTMPYISPEAMSEGADAIDTRADVYALGVIAYELMAGRQPFDVRGLPLAQAIQIVRSTAVPSLTRDGVAPDLDAIVLRAMNPDRERRYASAAELAADLRRYVRGEGVTARPPGAFRRLVLLARREKASALGVLAAVAGLLTGSVLAVRFGMIAARDRDAALVASMEADRKRDIAAAVTRFLQDTLSNADPARADRADATIRDALDHAERRVSEELSRQPEVEAAVRLTIAQTATSLGLFERAQHNAMRALELAATDELVAAEARHELGVIAREDGRYPQATQELGQAIAVRTGHLGLDHPLTLRSRHALATVMQRQGDYAGALAALRAILVARETLGDDPLGIAECHEGIGIALRHMDKASDAADAYELAIAVRRKHQRADHPHIAATLHSLSRAQHSMTDFSAAEATVREALRVQLATYGGPHPLTALFRRSLGNTLMEAGRWDEARVELDAAIEMYERCFPEGHGDLASTLVLRSRLAERAQEPATTQVWIERAHRMVRERGNFTDRLAVTTAFIQHELQAGRIESAMQIARGHAADTEGHFGPDHTETANALTFLASTSMRSGDFAGAREAIGRATRILTAAHGASDARAVESMHNQAFVERAAGELTAARDLFERVADLRIAAHGPDHPNSLHTRYELARTLHQIGAEPERTARLLLELMDSYRRRTEPAAAVRVSDCAMLLASLPEAAVGQDPLGLLESALAHIEAILPDNDPRLEPLRGAISRRRGNSR